MYQEAIKDGSSLAMELEAEIRKAQSGEIDTEKDRAGVLEVF